MAKISVNDSSARGTRALSSGHVEYLSAQAVLALETLGKHRDLVEIIKFSPRDPETVPGRVLVDVTIVVRDASAVAVIGGVVPKSTTLTTLTINVEQESFVMRDILRQIREALRHLFASYILNGRRMLEALTHLQENAPFGSKISCPVCGDLLDRSKKDEIWCNRCGKSLSTAGMPACPDCGQVMFGLNGVPKCWSCHQAA